MKKNKVIRLISTLLIVIVLTAGCSSDTNSSFQEKDLANYDKGAEIRENTTFNLLTAGGVFFKKNKEMQSLKDAITDILGDNYWPNSTISQEDLASETGITPEMYEDYMAEWEYNKTSIDMLIVIKAQEDKVGEVELALNNYREEQLKKYEHQVQNMSKVFASRIETINNYICYVQLGADTAQAAEEGEEEIISLCQEYNERAIDAIEKTLFAQ